MIDILKFKHLFPLKNFQDVEDLFQLNLDPSNGEPNLTLLSIVAGLIEHSLVTVSDKDDLASNSRPVYERKDAVHKRFSAQNPISNNHHLSSTSSETSNRDQSLPATNNNEEFQETNSDTEYNEATYISNDVSERSETSSPDITASDNLTIPEIEFEIVELLYKKFVDQIKNSVDFKDNETGRTNLKIKKISDCVWEHLSNSYYKDKAHLQSIFSYLTTNKLDCFGLAFAVIAGCQILNLTKIYLALSEDHAWVMYDVHEDEPLRSQKEKELKEYRDTGLPIPSCARYGTCEVTWHGKANSDRRGQSVTYKQCWLYTNGYAVKCDTIQCVVALVNSINPMINTNTDSEILALLQQRLLWLLFEKDMYFPMSLGNLAELEALCPTLNPTFSPIELMNLAINISRSDYDDSHVYPYSYLASFFYKNGRFKEALETWADASSVMTKYKYSKADEEIYKEFFEVANELIPSMLKVLTAGGLEPGRVSSKPFLQDPECLALILKFYDNICSWEEGSSTPVLHIGWAKNFVATALKFNPTIRSKMKLPTDEEWRQAKARRPSECEVSSRADPCSSTCADQPGEGLKSDQSRGSKRAHSSEDKVDTSESSTSKIKFEVPDKTNASSPQATSSTPDSKPRTIRGLDTSSRSRDRELETEDDGGVTVVLRSRKMAGLRDLLQAERFNKTAIELQLTAQSQCAVRGRSNSSSYSFDFVSTALTPIVGSTRSKRLLR